MADIHAKMMASLRREQVGTKIEQYDDSKVKNHWRRTRKPTVDLCELPIAVDRQLEDQRIQQEYNRNPRVHIPTKVDKVRSEQIVAKQGNSRDVGIKANVVNKFVREASGIHTYALVAPPRLKGEVIPMDPDPETNPFVKTYAKETKKKPVIVSFGHRPSSASRVFNPGTMKIKMKHNEFATAPREGKFEFGLPVGILGKLLKAPKITMPGAGGDEEDFSASGSAPAPDPHGLFTAPPRSPGQADDAANENSYYNGPTSPTSPGGVPARGFDESVRTEYLGAPPPAGGEASWVSGGETGLGFGSTVMSTKADNGLFTGGLGNIDYLDFRVPGFPVGGEVKGKGKKKKANKQQLTPVRFSPSFLYSDLCAVAISSCVLVLLPVCVPAPANEKRREEMRMPVITRPETPKYNVDISHYCPATIAA